MKRVLPSHGGEFTPAPAGLHPAICVDVVDKGWQENKTFGGWNPKISIVWQIDRMFEKDGNEVRFLTSAWYTLSIHRKANLRRDLESWFATQLDTEKIEADGGMDLDKLIGKRCALTIGHIQNKDNETRAVVQAVSPLASGMAQLELNGSYSRVEDRDDYSKPKPSAFEPREAEVYEPPSEGFAEDGPPPPADDRDHSGGNPDDDIPF